MTLAQASSEPDPLKRGELLGQFCLEKYFPKARTVTFTLGAPMVRDATPEEAEWLCADDEGEPVPHDMFWQDGGNGHRYGVCRVCGMEVEK